MLINVIPGHWTYFNTRGLMFPFVYYKRILQDIGIQVVFLNKNSERVKECDLLLLDSKVFRNCWSTTPEATLEEIDVLCEGPHKTIWFNTGDSSAGVQKQVIDKVDRYYKSQLLKDRKSYMKSYYGGRVYTDYYFRRHDVTDDVELWSTCLDERQLEKLRVSWNLGMNPCMDYWQGLVGRVAWDNRLLNLLAYRRSNCDRLFRKKRKIKINSNMSLNYPRNSVSYQRRTIAGILAKEGITVSKVPLRKYYDSLANSKYALSPYGWGEICIRDFEAVLSGCTLVKPDMSHLETWPDIYSAGETYLAFPWDLDCFDEWYEDNLIDENYTDDVARTALERYERYIGEDGSYEFTKKIRSIVQDLGF